MDSKWRHKNKHTTAKYWRYVSIGRSENKSTMQISPLENEVRPGVVHTLQEFLFAEVKIFVLIEQGGHISPPYRLKKEELKMNRKSLGQSSALQV